MEMYSSIDKDSDESDGEIYFPLPSKIARIGQTNQSTSKGDKPKKKMSYKDILHTQNQLGRAVKKPQEENRELKKIILRRNETSVYGKSTAPKTSQRDTIDIVLWRPSPQMLNVDIDGLNLRPKPQHPYVMVNDNASYWRMHTAVSKEIEIGLDLEQNNTDSHLGIICLIQISTKVNTYLIDPFKIPHECEDNLKKILENQNILKIVNDVSNDYRALVRDFKTYMWPVIDVQLVHYLLSKEDKNIVDRKTGYSKLIKNYLEINLEKAPQMADWRLRPIENMKPEMIQYAIRDSLLLLPLWNTMKGKLESFGIGRTNSLRNEIFQEMKDVVCNIQDVPKCYKTSEKDFAALKFKPSFSKIQQASFEQLHRKRFLISRRQDEAPDRIVRTHSLVQAAKTGIPVPQLEGHEAIANPSIRCYRCPIRGHTANKCPNKEMYKKMEMSRLYYSECPEKLAAEKERLKTKKIVQNEARGRNVKK